jgi:hypothetical protein
MMMTIENSRGLKSNECRAWSEAFQALCVAALPGGPAAIYSIVQASGRRERASSQAAPAG